VAVGVGLGMMWHVTRVLAFWLDERVLSSFGPNMVLHELNLGLALAFPVAPGLRR
jgi:hypothetical protein